MAICFLGLVGVTAIFFLSGFTMGAGLPLTLSTGTLLPVGGLELTGDLLFERGVPVGRGDVALAFRCFAEDLPCKPCLLRGDGFTVLMYDCGTLFSLGDLLWALTASPLTSRLFLPTDLLYRLLNTCLGGARFSVYFFLEVKSSGLNEQSLVSSSSCSFRLYSLACLRSF